VVRGPVPVLGRGLTPETYILYRAFRTLRKYSKVLIIINVTFKKYSAWRWAPKMTGPYAAAYIAYA